MAGKTTQISKLKEFIRLCNDFDRTITSISFLNMNADYDSKAEIDPQTAEWRVFYNRVKSFFKKNDFDKAMVNYGHRFNSIVQNANFNGIDRECITELVVFFNEIIDYLDMDYSISSSQGDSFADDKDSLKKNVDNKIFISHNSYDKDFCKALVAFLHGIGIQKSEIVCTSLDGYGPEVGDDIYEWLRHQFSYKLHVVYILSKAYYNSPPSLNEMGAAWVLNQAYTSFILPGFHFDMIKGAVNPQKISIEIDQNIESLRSRLRQFSQLICGEFDKAPIAEDQLNLLANSFADSVSVLKKTYEPNGFRTLINNEEKPQFFREKKKIANDNTVFHLRTIIELSSDINEIIGDVYRYIADKDNYYRADSELKALKESIEAINNCYRKIVLELDDNLDKYLRQYLEFLNGFYKKSLEYNEIFKVCRIGMEKSLPDGYEAICSELLEQKKLTYEGGKYSSDEVLNRIRDFIKI